MDNNFLKVFQQNLIKEDFTPINFSFHNTDILYFFKQIGNSLYFILPVKDNINYKECFASYEHYVKNNIITQNISNVFWLEIIISENKTNELIDYVTYNSNFNDKIIKLKWLIYLKENQIISKGNQANKLLNISKIIKNSFNEKFNNKSVSETLKAKRQNKSKLLKSKNIHLTLSVIGVLVFIHFYLLSQNLHNKFVDFGSTTPTMFANKEYYRMLTHAFLHSDIYHLSSNCLSIYIFGSRIEKYMGKFNFIFIYFIGIISSSIFSYFFSNSYSIGASGAIFALEGAILYYSLKTKITLDNLDFYYFITLSIIGISSGFFSPNIDNAGHIGGFISGIIVSFIICCFKKKKI